MNVNLVKLNRKYNLGNYETLDVGFEAELTEQEGANSQGSLDALKTLEKLADTYFEMVRFQKPAEKPKEAAKPEPPKVNPVIAEFPAELQQHLSVKDGAIYCEYVSRDKWTEINNQAKELGYKWVSEGKNSRWQKK